jgi:hypothetical protein
MLGRMLGRTLGKMIWKTPEPSGTAGKFSAGMQAIFLVILALICGALTYAEGSSYWAYTFNRGEAQATVAETVLDQKSSTHKVLFDFVTEAGEHIRGERPVSFERSQAMKPGQSLTVIYDKTHPARHQLAPYSATPWFAVVLAVLTLASLSSVVSEFRKIVPGKAGGLRAQLPGRVENWLGRIIRMGLGAAAAAVCYLLASGAGIRERLSGPDAKTAQGAVVSKWTSPAIIGDKTVYNVGYRFMAGDGKEIKHSSVVGKERYDALHEGEEISVTYMPGMPDNNSLSSEVNTAGEARWLLWAAAALALCYAVWQAVSLYRFERSYREVMRDIERIEEADRQVAAGAPSRTVSGAEKGGRPPTVQRG